MYNNDSTVYSSAGLNDGVAALSDAHKALTTLLDELKKELATSLGQWEDNARVAYTQVQAQWDASALRQQEIVRELPVLLSQISDGYDATERKTGKLWMV